MAHWTITGGHFVDQQLYDCTQGAPCTVTTPTP
jgi:hypothetical protein